MHLLIKGGVKIVTILIAIIAIFLLGFIIGLLYGAIRWKADYGGTIYMTKEEGKTLYSLVLDDYPETIEFKKKMFFKVDVSQNEDRD